MVKMIIYKDEVFGFFEIFNEENGTLFRSDINGVDPVMRSFPELLDVGIMGHCNGGQYCRNAGIDCYQKGFTTYAPHMSYENFMEIVKQAAGKTFQIALGGAGDPNKHPQIEDILKSCRAFGIWDKSISESMNSKTLREIWQGDKFVAFREQRKEKCSSCRQMELCRGGCRLGIDIDMC